MLTLTFFISLILSFPGYPGAESTADYNIEVSLDPDSTRIQGTMEMVFTSGVDFPVDTLWLHLYPNAYRDCTTAFAQDLESQGSFSFRRSDFSERGWIELSNWRMNGEPVEIHVDGSLGFIVLNDSLPGGQSVSLSGDFLVEIPNFWGRMGHSGDTYQITQWYPKMCVLDSDGWHRSRYHAAGEFYSDYGSYCVAIEVPSEFVTAATGKIQSTNFSADSTRRIDSWTSENVHDFAWCSSPDYTIRTHSFTYPDSGGTVKVHLVLLDDSEDYWADIPGAVDSTLAYYGEWYTPYPYDDLWVVDPVEPGSGGMEYPQFVFAFKGVPLTRIQEMVTIHEVGHQWFYGLLGNNETDEAWLDEGMNTFSELRYMERRYGFHGNLTKTPAWLLDAGDRDMQLVSFVSGASSDVTPVLSTATDAGDGSYSTGYTYYTKPALFLSMIQSQLGDSLFDEVMDTYFQRFAWHHPHTDDFQAVLEELSGQSWQQEFDFWLRGTGSMDIRLSSLQIRNDSTSVVMGGLIPYELLVPVVFSSSTDTLTVMVTALPGEQTTVSVPGGWSRAVADPLMRFPDKAPWNNSEPAIVRYKPLIVPFPEPGYHSIWVLPYPGYADGSWRANAMLISTPVPVEAGGPYTFASTVSMPFKRDASAALGLSLSVPLLRNSTDNIISNSRFFTGYGINRLSTGISWHTKGTLAVDRRRAISFGTQIFSVTDTTVYGGSNLQLGTSMEIQSGLRFSRRMFNMSYAAGLKTFADPGFAGDAYAGVSFDAEMRNRLSGSFTASTRVNVEGVTENAPVHRLVRSSGGLFADNSLVGALLPPDGLLSPLEHYCVRTGPALPGYWNNTVTGRIGFSLEQRLMPGFIPLGLFAGTGWVGNSLEDLSEGSLMSNAGVVLDAAVVEAIFPLWVSDPAQGEDNWEFRWRFRVAL
ncbi:MAG: M1 family metallopeptidase [Candidatus Fermentibacteraceae bacterium]|nr:M1 family metallopeptidase [Candidatus Fermentibacteraceae bacterium]